MRRGWAHALAPLALAWSLCACGDGDPVPVPPDAGRRLELEASVAPLPEFDAQVSDAQSAEVDAAEASPPPPPGLARNLIVFMGDGMGPEQLSTARYVKPRLRIDEMDGPGFANTDSLTTLRSAEPELEATDSAAGATVIATGVRVINGALSVSEAGEPLETVLEVCQRRGKATGLVTTSYFFDASPAAFTVHQAARGDYDAILRQMLGSTRPDVLMGHDLRAFDEPELGYLELARANGYTLLRGVAELAAWDPRAQPRVIGVFSTDFVPAVDAADTFMMTPALERRPDSPDPSLATMTARALERLADDPDGFFLFAEDELLDVMGHRGPAEVAWANRAYPRQAAALDDAVGVAIDWVRAHSSFEETLIVLLADHETGGYQYDRARGPESGTFSAYSEGESYRAGNHSRRPTAVYALGPGSAAVSGVREHADTHLLLLGELPVTGKQR